MKYEFTGETKVVFGITLKRIRALMGFGVIAKGELGGWIEKEENLSRVSGDAWVFGNARVSGNAWVSGDAWVFSNARVLGDARVFSNTSFLLVGPIGSCFATLTVTADAQLGLRFTTDCFSGSRAEFVAAVAATHGAGKFRVQYDLAVALADCSVTPCDPADVANQEAA